MKTVLCLQQLALYASGFIFKVRDIYDEGDYLVLVIKDRQSVFDRILVSIPIKVVSVPDRDVTIARKCLIFPVEFFGTSVEDGKLHGQNSVDDSQLVPVWRMESYMDRTQWSIHSWYITFIVLFGGKSIK